VRKEVSDVEKEMLTQPPKSVLLLVETAGTVISPEAVNLFKNVTSHYRKVLKKIPILGMTGARKAIRDIVAKFAGMGVVAFDSEEKGKDWLVSD
jgi:hypothetical protein